MQILCSCFLVAAYSSVFGGVIYDVNFNTDAVGSPASVGGVGPPFSKPTSLGFGTSRVVSSFGSLNDKPLVLIPQASGSPRYSQYQFDFAKFDSSPAYTFDFDLIYSGAPTGNVTTEYFTMLFDASPLTSFTFWNKNGVGTINRFISGQDPGTDIGTFPLGEAIHITASLDQIARTISLSENGVLLGTRTFSSVPAQRDIRFNLADDPSIGGVPTGVIDNIRIVGVPEMSSGLFGLGVLLVAGCSRTCRKDSLSFPKFPPRSQS